MKYKKSMSALTIWNTAELIALALETVPVIVQTALN